jgi:hypothetical protein
MSQQRNPALGLLIFVAVLIGLNGLFWVLGLHVHIDIIGSVVLSLVVSGILYGVYALRAKG